MLWEHEPLASVSTAFSSSPKLSRVFLLKLDRSTELARAFDVMMARAKRIYTLIIKVNRLFSFFSSRCFLKRNRKHVLRVSIES